MCDHFLIVCGGREKRRVEGSREKRRKWREGEEGEEGREKRGGEGGRRGENGNKECRREGE